MSNIQVKEVPENSIHKMPDVLKVDEVAQFLRIDRGLAYEMIRQKTIPCIRLGRAIRVPKMAVVRMLEGNLE